MKITGFEDIVSIDQFVYCIAVDKHEECRFTVSITEKSVSKYKSQLGKKCVMEHDDFRFEGTVTEVSVVPDIGGTLLGVVVQGDTIGFDTDCLCRIFQDSEKNFSDILKGTGMSEVVYQSSEDMQIEQIIVQSNETDWNFILRMAKYLGKHIFPGKKKWIGDPQVSSSVIENDDILTMKQILRKGNSEILCTLKKKLEFGCQVQHEEIKYYVDCIQYKMICGIYTYQYHLQEIGSAAGECVFPTYDLTAVVQDNDDPEKLGRVKVEFTLPYEDVMKNDAMWIDCDSGFATKDFGVVCIPSVGDTVIVHITGATSRIQAVRRTEAYGDRYQDCNSKYIFFDADTHIETNKEKFIFDNNKFRCEISSKECLIKFGDEVEITIDENGIKQRNEKCNIEVGNQRIYLNTEKTKIEIASETKIQSEGIGIDGNKKFDVTASKVNIKGKSGVSIN